jgi:hypothetical protein
MTFTFEKAFHEKNILFIQNNVSQYFDNTGAIIKENVNAECRRSQSTFHPTALDMAILNHNETNSELEMAAALIASGASVNHCFKDNTSSTPLMITVIRGHVELCELLLQNGATPNIRFMKSSLDILTQAVLSCIGHHSKGTVNPTKRRQIVQLLVQYGASMDYPGIEFTSSGFGPATLYENVQLYYNALALCGIQLAIQPSKPT